MRLETEYTTGNIQRFILSITGSILKSKLLALFSLLSMLCLHCRAEPDSFLLNGHYKSFFTAIDPADFKDNLVDQDRPVIGAVSNQLRLKLSYNLNDWSLAY